MSNPPFDHLDEMRELQKRIRRKRRLKMGCPMVARYQALYSQVVQYMPRTEEKFIRFLNEIHNDYERWMEGEVEEVREKLQAELDDATRRLEAITEAVQPYLKQENPEPRIIYRVIYRCHPK